MVKSLMLFISTLGVMIALSLSNVNAVNLNNTNFSIQVPNGWVYRENFFFINGHDTILTPNEFADPLITGNASALTDNLHDRVLVEVAPDLSFPVKNAPLEMYVEHKLKSYHGLDVTSENATIGGERAIKVFFNVTDQANKLGMTNVPSFVTLSYYVMHGDQPYFLNYAVNSKNYIVNSKNYQKYLPDFEQMVKTFKFTK